LSSGSGASGLNRRANSCVKSSTPPPNNGPLSPNRARRTNSHPNSTNRSIPSSSNALSQQGMRLYHEIRLTIKPRDPVQDDLRNVTCAQPRTKAVPRSLAQTSRSTTPHGPRRQPTIAWASISPATRTCETALAQVLGRPTEKSVNTARTRSICLGVGPMLRAIFYCPHQTPERTYGRRQFLSAGPA
jgi:hypothetical protein